jgi:hypothetical protein
MNLNLLMSIVVSSELKDWNHISCWGYGGAPSSREHLVSPDDDDNPCGRAHSRLSVYIPDISISIAFGLTWMEDFNEEWANCFPDRSACGCYADVFHNGKLVFREPFIIVDGGRTKLPMPPARDNLNVPNDQAHFIRMLDRFEGFSSFDDYFQRAGLRLTDAPWPVFGPDPNDNEGERIAPTVKKARRGMIQ